MKAMDGIGSVLLGKADDDSNITLSTDKIQYSIEKMNKNNTSGGGKSKDAQCFQN